MKNKIIVGLLVVLFSCSCTHQKSQTGLQIEKESYPHKSSGSGLLIENGINRGMTYTDSLGSKYNLRYIPISITNDTTIQVHLEITFSKEYNYHPSPDIHGKFRLLPLPTEWALDGGEITESMIDELKNFINEPSLNKMIEPGQEFVLGIGSLYPNPPNFSGVLPNTLFVHTEKGIFPSCDWQMKGDPSSNPIKNAAQFALGLRLNFGAPCMIIPCGQISYLNR